MKYFISLVICFGVTACYAQPAETPSFSNQKIGNVLSCLNTSLGKIDGAPPHATDHSYSVRYYYGVLTPGDEDSNELTLLAYGQDSQSASIYWVYFENDDHGKTLVVGQWGTLKREGNQWTVDEVPGGLASQAEDLKLVEAMEKRPAITIENSEVKPGTEACSYPAGKLLKH